MILIVIGGGYIVSQFLGSKEPQSKTQNDSDEKVKKDRRRTERKQNRRVKYV